MPAPYKLRTIRPLTYQGERYAPGSIVLALSAQDAFDLHASGRAIFADEHDLAPVAAVVRAASNATAARVNRGPSSLASR